MIEIGSLVMLDIPKGGSPHYGWGDMEKDLITVGVVREIEKNANRIVIYFPHCIEFAVSKDEVREITEKEFNKLPDIPHHLIFTNPHVISNDESGLIFWLSSTGHSLFTTPYMKKYNMKISVSWTDKILEAI